MQSVFDFDKDEVVRGMGLRLVSRSAWRPYGRRARA
jgi:hypothetical protein